jgi:hypothetical protein
MIIDRNRAGFQPLGAKHLGFAKKRLKPVLQRKPGAVKLVTCSGQWSQPTASIFQIAARLNARRGIW